jgi:hypothetical protein
VGGAQWGGRSEERGRGSSGRALLVLLFLLQELRDSGEGRIGCGISIQHISHTCHTAQDDRPPACMKLQLHMAPPPLSCLPTHHLGRPI